VYQSPDYEKENIQSFARGSASGSSSELSGVMMATSGLSPLKYSASSTSMPLLSISKPSRIGTMSVAKCAMFVACGWFEAEEGLRYPLCSLWGSRRPDPYAAFQSRQFALAGVKGTNEGIFTGRGEL
jgi:hypothetical protein